jgi:hypothetical protein
VPSEPTVKRKSARSYNFVRLVLQHAGWVAKAKRCGAHRRERKPLIGVVQDGSRYE